MKLPIAAKCPSCGAPLSEAAVAALAPVCLNCGSVLISIGGTLGLTGAYGVSDPHITRSRVEADLAVLQKYQYNARGARLAFTEQLAWDVDRYAKLPEPPQLLSLVPVPNLWDRLWPGLVASVVWFAVTSLLAWLVVVIVSHISGNVSGAKAFVTLIIVSGYILCFWGEFLPYIKARIENGTRPAENARRQDVYEKARDAALRAAEPVKAAADHRLRTQIRDLEAQEKVLSEKATQVSHVLLQLR